MCFSQEVGSHAIQCTRAERTRSRVTAHLLPAPWHVQKVLHSLNNRTDGVTCAVKCDSDCELLHTKRHRGAPRRVVLEQPCCAALLHREKHELCTQNSR